MHPASTPLRGLLITNAVFLAILNIPASTIPPWAIPAGELLRTLVVMSVLFLPILTNVFLGYAAYYRVEEREARWLGSLLLINGVAYWYTATPLSYVFGLSTFLSFGFFYAVWFYRCRFFDRHAASYEQWKEKKSK